MMREAQAVAEKLGVRIQDQLDKRIAGAEAVGAHKTSMLQDVEAGARWNSKRWWVRCANWAASPKRRRRPSTPSTPALSLLAKTLGEQSGKLAIAAR
jgi:2-dehydropantoate 2-reductase